MPDGLRVPLCFCAKAGARGTEPTDPGSTFGPCLRARSARHRVTAGPSGWFLAATPSAVRTDWLRASPDQLHGLQRTGRIRSPSQACALHRQIQHFSRKDRKEHKDAALAAQPRCHSNGASNRTTERQESLRRSPPSLCSLRSLCENRILPTRKGSARAIPRASRSRCPQSPAPRSRSRPRESPRCTR